MVRSVLLAVWLTGSAYAAPTTHQGRLLTATGALVDGDVRIVVQVFPSAIGGEGLVVFDDDVAVQHGYYAIELDPAIQQVSEGWVQITADGVELGPRQALSSVPVAEHARRLLVSDGPPEACDPTTLGRLYLDSQSGQPRVCSASGWSSMGGATVGQAPGGIGLGAVTGATPGSTVTSNTVALDVDAPVSVVLTAGDGLPYASLVRNGADTAQQSTVYQPGDSLAVRMTAADTYLTSRVVLAYVGGVTTDWSVTTAADTSPDAFTFDAVPSAALSSTVTSNTVSVIDFTGTLPLVVTGGATIVHNSVDTGLTSVDVQDGDAIALRLQTDGNWDTPYSVDVSLGDYTTTWSVTNRGECTPGEQTFTSAGSYSFSVTSDLLGCTFTVQAIGGGGGGGGSGAGYQSAGGAGGGGYAAATVTFDATETVAVSVGAGGGVTNSFGGSGGSGGPTTFGPYVTATGGHGSAGVNSNYTGSPGAPGGIGSVGAGAVAIATYTGGHGGWGGSNPHRAGGGGGAAGPGGNGGSASGSSPGAGNGGVAGGGGQGSENGSSPGASYGGGGSGAHHGNDQGRGGRGWLRVQWE